jgi:HTH-type transcriptional regulator, transcriptional repressor of NAD biosynthesis genes
VSEPRRGLTLGKYAPLHRGHQFVIETGLSETDEMVVLVYDAPETTTIPLAVRSGWVRALYPSARVIEAWDGPTEVGYSADLMRRHERYVVEDLGITGVTHFFSSEPYGDHMSLALGAIDRRVDEARTSVPVSATDIRDDPFAHRAWVPPLVYRDLITSIVFLGAPCTGKTTLAGRLADEFETSWMPEYGREYWEKHHVNRRLTPGQLVEIAQGHLEREDALLAEANRYLFVDTNAMTTATFARTYHGGCDPRLAGLARQAASRYDLVFVCDLDFPYEDTWDRSGDVKRAAFQRQVIGDLNRRRVPFFVLRGTIEERVSQVRRVLSQFTKFTNLLDPGMDAES